MKWSLRLIYLNISVLLLHGSLLGQVDHQRLIDAGKTPEDWLTYSGSYSSQRYSSLSEINPKNVADLKTIWVYQMRHPGLVEASPLIADGVLYLTEPPSTVTALDLATGRPLWTWSPRLPPNVLHIGFPKVNRGVALLEEWRYWTTWSTWVRSMPMCLLWMLNPGPCAGQRK